MGYNHLFMCLWSRLYISYCTMLTCKAVLVVKHHLEGNHSSLLPSNPDVNPFFFSAMHGSYTLVIITFPNSGPRRHAVTSSVLMYK